VPSGHDTDATMTAEESVRRERASSSSFSDAKAAQVVRDYLLGLISEVDAHEFFEAYEEKIVSRMMRSPEGVAGWAHLMGSVRDERERQAVQARLEAAKAWQRRILRERHDPGNNMR
jgi:hypothetical protein